VDAIAASAASIIAMAGDTRTMGVNCMMMVHNASSFCWGDAAAMRKTADTLDKVSESIGATYVARTKLNAAEVKALMDATTFMSAADCLANGFATHVVEEPDEQSAQAMAMARGFKAFARLKNLPEALRPTAAKPAPVQPATAESIAAGLGGTENVCACDCANCGANNCDQCTATDCEDENCQDCPMQAGATASAAAPAASGKVKAENGNGCECDCENCVANNCDQCDAVGCADPDCVHCPMQLETEDASNLSLYEALEWQLLHVNP